MLETERNRLPDRIQAAEDAIQVRGSLEAQVASDERMAIRDAMAAVLGMRRESLKATR